MNRVTGNKKNEFLSFILKFFDEWGEKLLLNFRSSMPNAPRISV